MTSVDKRRSGEDGWVVMVMDRSSSHPVVHIFDVNAGSVPDPDPESEVIFAGVGDMITLYLRSRILGNDDSLFALPGLLTMNRYIASVTVPFLYRDPYRNAFHQEGPGKRNKWRSTTPGMLTRMLLGSRSVASLLKSLALALTSGSANISTTSTITTTSTMTNLRFNYIGYIRRLDMRAYTSLVTIRSWIPQGLSSCQLTYIHSDEFGQLCQLNPFTPTYAFYLSTQDHILKHYYEIMLEQDTLWSLADPILEQLEFFAVPHILSINRFQQVVGRYDLNTDDLDNLDDIAFAFSQSLRYLKVDVPTQGYLNLLNAPKPLHLGRGWVDLPLLTSLCLYVYSYRLVVDPPLLSRCLNLAHLWLDDSSLEYSWQDLVPCQPARLGRLDILSLCGWSALTFDPATLSSTTGLKSLSIQIRSWHYGNEEVESFIPPVEELNQSYGIHTEPAAMGTDAALGIIRPRWTWDWQLPFLTSLKLAFEVAYLFEFKMLHGCPSLTGLSLDIFSLTPADHTRIVSESDLLVPITSNSIGTSSTSPSSSSTSLSSSSSSNQPMPERLCLPNLVQITLNGAWVIDDRTMPIFLAETFPNVKQVQQNRWTTTTLESLFKLFRSIPQKYDESVSLAITRLSSLHDMARLGIDKVHENYFRQREASGDDDEDDDEDSGDAYLGVKLELYDLLYDGNHYRILKR
ncbi:MAG: hypothetical protein J3R72DRAFT_418520 [Linnemannia gamsii]|nr:MAG: hypothetical protein J3R72DRAFT_418520 [Linnemannia gamsii]